MAYYQRIRDLREDADKTQKQVADDLFMHVSQYYNISIDYIAGLTNEKTVIKPNNITTLDMKFLSRFKQLSEIQKGRILERIDIITEKEN